MNLEAQIYKEGIDLFDDLLRNRFDFFPLRNITFVIHDIV